MFSKKKKVIVLVGMLSLLVLTGVLNVVLNNVAADHTGGGGGGAAQTCFFVHYREVRAHTREETLLHLDAIIANASTSEQGRSDAEAARLTVVQNMELELTLEGLVRAMGFSDVVVSASNNNFNVIVRTAAGTDNIEEFQAAQILDIVLSETTASAQNIRIIPIEG